MGKRGVSSTGPPSGQPIQCLRQVLNVRPDSAAFVDTSVVQARYRVGDHDNSVVAFRSLVNRCPRAVREVAARENNCIAARFTQMPVEFGAVEGTPGPFARLVYQHAQPAPAVAGRRLPAIHVPAQQHWVTARGRSGIRRCPARRFAHPALPIAVAPGRRSNRPGGTTGRHARSGAEIHGRLSPTSPLPELPHVFPQCASENRRHKSHAARRLAPMLPIPQLDAYSDLRASRPLAGIELER